ncbi:hypothetical protein V1318_14030 [Lysobacter sp. CCNWLW3]|uniref:hypothetical protein n=1 Tax=unclassified Lysobacter TaxID=2635362 RepID=UPI002FD6CC4D
MAMIFAIALEVSQEVTHLSSVIAEINQCLERGLLNKDYGEGLDHVYVGLIMTGGDPAGLHSRRPFKFKKTLKVRDLLGGRSEVINNVAQYDIKPNYDAIRLMSPEEFRGFIVDEILVSANVIQENMKFYPNLDFNSLIGDMSASLRSRN